MTILLSLTNGNPIGTNQKIFIFREPTNFRVPSPSLKGKIKKFGFKNQGAHLRV